MTILNSSFSENYRCKFKSNPQVSQTNLTFLCSVCSNFYELWKERLASVEKIILQLNLFFKTVLCLCLDHMCAPLKWFDAPDAAIISSNTKSLDEKTLATKSAWPCKISNLVFNHTSKCWVTIMDYVLCIHNTNIFCSITLSKRWPVGFLVSIYVGRSKRECVDNVEKGKKESSLPVNSIQADSLDPMHGSSHSAK